MSKNLQLKVSNWLLTIAVGGMVLLCSTSEIRANELLPKGNNISISQQTKQTLKQAIERISSDMGYKFAYNPQEINLSLLVDYNKDEKDIEKLLSTMLYKTTVAYEVKGKQIILTLKTPFQLRVKVVGKDKKPIIGAMVVTKDGDGGIADANGFVVINKAIAGMNFEVSCVGMVTQFFKVVNGKNEVIITLMNDVIAMDDVIVTGYQTISKERSTGAYNIIKKDNLEKPATDISQRLVGTTAGMVPTLDANNNANFEIRGKSSLNSNAQPLIIVDGFAVEDGFNSVNPNNVENITILKDAAAASIWGARAGNGVIVITTKKAKSGKAIVDLSMFIKFAGKQDINYLRPSATSNETVDYEVRAINNKYFGYNTYPKPDAANNITSSYGLAGSIENEYRLGFLTEEQRNSQIDALRNLDNRQQITDYLLNAPVTQQYNLNITGGSERMSNNLSLIFSDSENFFKYNNTQDYLINYKTQLNVFKWLDFNFSSMMQYKENRNGGLSAAEIVKLSPYEMLYNEDGTPAYVTANLNRPMLERHFEISNFPYSDWSRHPVLEAQNVDFRTRNINARVQAVLNFKIMKGLTFSTSMQYEIFTENVNKEYGEGSYATRYEVNYKSAYNTKTKKATANFPKGSMLDRTNNEVKAYIIRNQLNFNRTFNQKHSVDAIIGSETSNRVATRNEIPRVYGYDGERMVVGAMPGTINGLKNMIGGSFNVNILNKFTYGTDRFFSLYGNVAYSFDKKYSITGSIRTDASNFISDDPKYRYSPFWSIGGSWNIHNEKFMNNIEIVDRLVLRATYGYNGNIDRTTSFMPLITLGSNADVYSGKFTSKIASYGNPDLRWERIGSFNIGTDFSLWKGTLVGTVEFYNKQAKDLIVDVTMPSFNGTKTQKLNEGEMLNRGIEITLGTTQQIYKNFITWNGNLTFAYNKNSITKLNVLTYSSQSLYMGTAKSYVEGYDSNTIWALKYDGEKNLGTEDKPNIKPVILGKDGKNYMMESYPAGDGFNYVYDMGTKVAPYTASFSSSFKIYDFDLSFILTGKFGHKFMRTGYNYAAVQPKLLPNKYLTEVVEGGSDKFFQVPDNSNRFASFQTTFILPYLGYLAENASHIRFQEVNITYSLPKRITNKIGLNYLKVFAQANNIGTILFNDYNEDPEFKYGTIKPVATYTFGLKLSF